MKESMMMGKLKERKAKPIGSILYDFEIARTCLEGGSIDEPKALEEIEKVINKLEVTGND